MFVCSGPYDAVSDAWTVDQLFDSCAPMLQEVLDAKAKADAAAAEVAK